MKANHSSLPLMTLLLVIVSALSQALAAEERISLGDEAPGALLGVWQQVGDGRYLEVSTDKANFYHYTKSICYIDSAASGKPLAASYALFELSDNGQELKLWKWNFGERCEQQYFERFLRAQSLPSGTVSNTRDDQRFDDSRFLLHLIVEQFDEHYPHFGRRTFDWQQRKETAVSGFKEDASAETLFNTVRDMIQGLGDSHTRFFSRQTKQSFKSGQAQLLDYLDKEFARQDSVTNVGSFRGAWHGKQHAGITPLLRDNTIQRAINGRFRWGILEGNIGYLENDLLTAFSPSGTPREQELPMLEEGLDSLMVKLANCDAILLDLSFNQGGYDPAALMIAARFADRRRLVFTRHTPGYPAGQVDSFFVSPRGPIQFIRPVYVLASNATVSAGESLAAMLKAFPHVTQLGEPTRGCLSSFLNKPIPPYFHLTMANEVYTGPNGDIWEGGGVEPDIAFDVFTEDDIFGSYPQALKKAADIILKRQ